MWGHDSRTLLGKGFTRAFVFLAMLLVVCGVGGAAGEVLYQSDFSSVPDGKLPEGFRVLGGTWSVQDGRLIGWSPSWQNGQIVFGDPEWDNYEIEATITFLSADEPTRWAALMYRGPAVGRAPYYLFTIRQNAAAANGLELAYRTADDASWNVHLTKAWREPVQIGRPYRLRVIVHERAAVYFFEGERVLETERLITEPNGTIGFVTNGTRIAVDEIVVRALDEQAMALLPKTVQGVVPRLGGSSVPLVIAHRGASGTEPENTLPAIAKAIEVGADLIEIDVHPTKDGHVVVIHDGTVDRTAKGAHTGNVRDLTLDQIKALDAGIWKTLTRRGTRVPTLEEALLAADGEAIFLIENKAPGIERQIAEVIRKTGMERNVVFQSFDANSVRTFRLLMPEVPAAVLFGNPGISDDVERAESMIRTALQANAQVVAVNYGAVTPEFVRYIQARGLNVWVWTVNGQGDMERMIRAGVDAIITDYPEILRDLLAE